MIIIAIDPGYDRLGIAILQKEKNSKEKILFSECFITEREESFYKRLFALGKRIDDLIKKFEPKALVLEDLFFSRNTKTALKVSEARGVIVFQALNNNIPIFEYKPNQIKVAITGYGSAKKEDVFFMVKKLISLEGRKYIDDEIDAIAAGLTFFAHTNNFV
ncbi:MAG: crossover junction endodeoxyribonuclease RuvC [Candidatus Pacebacteria bacterium]|nr:crossover junction endodeoxyribonuclease RuvC [Candidatus Paceibacterota bacterium]